MSMKLMEYFNKSPRIGILSTSSRDGRVDSAVFGSPRMVDEKTVLIATAKNRTCSNLQENPYAIFVIVEPGTEIFDWKGIRVYMKVKELLTTGEVLDNIRKQMAKVVGEDAAKMMYAAVTFEVYEIRPLVDMGQGWENSI